MYVTESPSFKKKHIQQYGDMCHLNPILLISYQEEMSLQHYQNPHYGGRDQTFFNWGTTNPVTSC